jgi:hypothetical protein
MTSRSVTFACWSKAAFAGTLVLLAWSGGCINPQDAYDDFASRPLSEREAGVVDVALTPCQELLAKNLSGLYYTSCLPKDLPVPFALATQDTITPAPDGKTATLARSFTPLKTAATTMADTVGDPIVLQPVTIDENCAYTENIGTLTLGASANGLGRDLSATDVVLRGKLQSVDRSCSELDGKVDLIMLSLLNDGDYCIFVRAPSDGSIPTVSDSDYACDNSGLQPRGQRF